MSSTTTATLHRVHNFNAGPSALPLSVLERIREELLDWGGSGMSVMEMSHRSPEFESINAAAEAGLRKGDVLAEFDGQTDQVRLGGRRHSHVQNFDLFVPQ